ncbi:hypothetical protein EEL42_04775 [Muribaculaceae bacterium Isolate-100 (HZI)]|nr:hypothetical protein EEL42_04775 [Muribaculaceae bacterium Isolate-100 (HZI)]
MSPVQPPLTETFKEFLGISLGHLPEFSLSRSPEERDKMTKAWKLLSYPKCVQAVEEAFNAWV